MSPDPQKPDLSYAIAQVEACADSIKSDRSLSPKEVARLTSIFRRRFSPVVPQGRKPSPRIDAAFADWQAGIQGNKFYMKHVRNYTKLSHWRRDIQIRRLRTAIAKRKSRHPKPDVPPAQA